MSNIKKSAAVPFVNQKGERSMKRVKVERYVAGKRPAYAKDEDEEYYTTDDEDDDGEAGDESAEEQEASDEDDEVVEERLRKPVKTEQLRSEQDSSAHADINCDNPSRSPLASPTIAKALNDDDDDDEEEEDDDPRFRRLKQLKSKSDTTRLLQVQTTSRAVQKVEENPIVFDDEDDEEIKERHALARSRTLEELIEKKATTLGDFHDQQAIDDLIETEEVTYGRDATEDILDKIVITRIDPEEESRKAAALIEEQSRLFIEQAKQESSLVAQVHQKIKDDNERELEIEAKRKADLGGMDIESVRTDDEDEDIAYEEWKLREIKRVLRDRSEKAKAKT